MKMLAQISSKNVVMGRLAHLIAAFVFLALAGAPQRTSAAPGEPLWFLPHPPYPAVARMTHEQGTIIMTFTTDATGKVVKATASVPAKQKEDLPDLAKISVRWALANWRGPPNTTRKYSIEFRLQ